MCARLNQEAPDSNAFCFAYDKIKGSIGIPYERTQVSSHAEILSVRKPKMLLFGYGGTLFHEAPYHYERGFQALLANVESNPGNHTPKGISAFFEQMQKTVFDIQRKNHADVSQTVLLRALFERLGIHFLLTPLEMESVFYENAYQGRPTEGVGSLLDLLSEKGIRTGIVCNQSYSGQALSIHLRSVFPKHRFEMIVTSGDYLFQKPSPVLFEIAIQKANLSAAEIWFCGDDFAVDIKGAEMSRLFPVWYAGDAAGQIAPDRLAISCWDELAQLFKEPELSF